MKAALLQLVAQTSVRMSSERTSRWYEAPRYRTFVFVLDELTFGYAVQGLHPSSCIDWPFGAIGPTICSTFRTVPDLLFPATW